MDVHLPPFQQSKQLAFGLCHTPVLSRDFNAVEAKGAERASLANALVVELRDAIGGFAAVVAATGRGACAAPADLQKCTAHVRKMLPAMRKTVRDGAKRLQSCRGSRHETMAGDWRYFVTDTDTQRQLYGRVISLETHIGRSRMNSFELDGLKADLCFLRTSLRT